MYVPSAPGLDLLVGGEESTAQSHPVLQMATGAGAAPLGSVRHSCSGLQLPISLHFSFEKCD